MFLSWCCIDSFVFRRPVVKVFQHRENEKCRVYLLQRQETKLDCQHGAADQETVPSGPYAIEIHRR